MMNTLEVPELLPCVCVECKQSICEEIVADAIVTVEIVDGRTSRNINDSTLFIERHSCPVIGGSRNFPCILWPGIVAIITGQRNRVKAPSKRAGVHIKGTNVAVESRFRLRSPEANDDHVLIDHARRC